MQWTNDEINQISSLFLIIRCSKVLWKFCGVLINDRNGRKVTSDWLLDQSRRPLDLACCKPPTTTTTIFFSSFPHTDEHTHAVQLDQPPLTTGCLFAPRNLHSTAYGATGLPMVQSPLLGRLQSYSALPLIVGRVKEVVFKDIFQYGC